MSRGGNGSVLLFGSGLWWCVRWTAAFDDGSALNPFLLRWVRWLLLIGFCGCLFTIWILLYWLNYTYHFLIFIYIRNLSFYLKITQFCLFLIFLN